MVLRKALKAGVVFLFCSYLLGPFLFFVGSWLDDVAYDPLRKLTTKAQITRLPNRRSLSPKVIRGLVWLCFKENPDAAVDRIVPIKEGYLKRIDAPRAVNAFQWCKARLTTDHTEALAVVNRFEADSKFFRSFVPVLLVVLGTAIYCQRWSLASGSIVALGLAFQRFVERRFKSTQYAYWHLLTIEASKAPMLSNTKTSSSSPSAEKPVPSHAGGVVFRRRHSRIEYLLLQAKADPDDWVLPKGHIEPHEDPQYCAIREVKKKRENRCQGLESIRDSRWRRNS